MKDTTQEEKDQEAKDRQLFDQFKQLIHVNRLKRKPSLEDAQKLFDLVKTAFHNGYGFVFDNVAPDTMNQIFGYCFDATHKGATLLPLVCKNWKLRYESLLNKRLRMFLKDTKIMDRLGWLLMSIGLKMGIISKISWFKQQQEFTLTFDRRNFIFTCELVLENADSDVIWTSHPPKETISEYEWPPRGENGFYCNWHKVRETAKDEGEFWITWESEANKQLKDWEKFRGFLQKHFRPGVSWTKMPQTFGRIPRFVKKILITRNKLYKFF